jgi:DNA polymerase III subunit alpha
MLLAFAARLQKQASSGQVDLFGNASEALVERVELKLDKPLVDYDTREQLMWERELLGLYLSQHPLEVFETFLSEQTVPLASIKPEHDGKAVTVGGAISEVRDITTKNGKKMAFVKLEDQTGEIEAILFPNAYQQTLGIWERDKVVLVRGKVNSKDRDGTISQEAKIMVDDAREVTAAQAMAYQATGKKRKAPKTKPATAILRGPGAKAAAATEPLATPRLYIRLASSEDQQKLMTLKQTLDAFQGQTEVVLVLGEASNKQAIKLPAGIDRESEALTRLSALVGSENIKVQ